MITYFSLVYVFEGISQLHICMYTISKRETILYIRGINFKAMHARGSHF